MAQVRRWVASITDPDGADESHVWMLLDDLGITDRARSAEWLVDGLEVESTAADYTVRVNGTYRGEPYEIVRTISDSQTKRLTLPRGRRPQLGRSPIRSGW